MALIVFGFVCILLGWYGAAHSPYLYQEVPYLISGGLLGVALVIGGGVLVRSAWSMRQVEEDRRNAWPSSARSTGSSASCAAWTRRGAPTREEHALTR